MAPYRRCWLLLLPLLLLAVACTSAPLAAPPEAPRAAQPTFTPSLRLPTATPIPQSLLFASDRDGAGALFFRDSSGQVSRLTDPSAAPVWQPALQPNASRLLLTARRAGQSDLALLNLNGGEWQWLTISPAEDYSPAWSWDGQQVAWVSERGGLPQVWIASVGRVEEEAARLPGTHGEARSRDPAWAPDGTLLFTEVDEQGLEAMMRYDPASGTIERLTEWPFSAHGAAVNAAGEIIVVGRYERPYWRGLYRLGGGGAELLWETTDWIGEPTWSTDGQSILFTRGDRTGHDLWALPLGSTEPMRLTDDPAWETDAVPVPALRVAALPSSEEATAPTTSAPAPSRLRLGANMASLDNAYLIHGLGFEWVKGFADWERAEPEPGRFVWVDIDNTVNAAAQSGAKLLLRVDRTPTWARPPETIGSHPPDDLAAFRRWWEALARRYKGRVAAYELWNEPNLSYEWGNQAPDPIRYVEMMRVVHEVLERVDPEALLVVGALATTENSDRSMNDLLWMEAFYAQLSPDEPRPYDVFSTHPYPFGQPPDFAPEQGPGLRRVEVQHALMGLAGDDSPLWITEYGYVRESPAWDLGEHQASILDERRQAEYLVASLAWIEEKAPYVEALFLFNLDFSVVDWYPAAEQMRAYALLDPSRRPLPALTALRERAALAPR